MNPESYVPRTLKLEVARRGRLPVEECIQIGLSLTTALEFLHENGLVHRDVKLSNIIFVGGVPKLADIGLVADVDATVSIVGTEGYIPPEGPGKPQADIYSLGKVLYEACTGKDRQEFPEPPTLWEQDADESALREFHEVLLKACERDLAKRYKSARDMRADIALVQSGKSLRRLHTLERRVKTLTRMGVVGTTLLMLVVCAVFLVLYKRKAEVAEVAMLLAQARGNRLEQRAGHRFESLDLLKKAAAVRPSMDLRNEVIATMAEADFRIGPGNEPYFKGESLSFDPTLVRYARSDTNWNVSVRTSSAEEVGFFPAPRGADTTIWILKLSAGGRFLATVHHPMGRDEPNLLRIWDVDTKELILEWTDGISQWAMCFSDGTLAALAKYGGPIVIYDLETRRERNNFTPGVRPYFVRLSPNAETLAISAYRQPVVELRDTKTGATVGNLPNPDTVRAMSWHPNGRILACGGDDDNIDLWDTVTTQRVAVLKGHSSVVTSVGFSHSGALLASSGWDRSTRLWDPWQEKELARLAALGGTQFSPEDRWLTTAATRGPQSGRTQVAPAKECRVLQGRLRGHLSGASFSPDGRMFVTAGSEGVVLWDAETVCSVAFLAFPNCKFVRFGSDGMSLMACGSTGVWRWPVSVGDNGGVLNVSIGRREQISLPVERPEGLALSADGRFAALLLPDYQGGLLVGLDNPTKPVGRFAHPYIAFASFSPNGQWLATSTVGGSGVKIWEARTGALVSELPIPGRANVLFDPRGRWLVTGSEAEFRFWEVGTWAKRHGLEPEFQVQSVGWMAFSADGTVLAVPRVGGGVKLAEATTGRILATLDGPEQWPLCFSPDGAFLAVAQTMPEGKGDLVKLWNLRLVRQELAAMKLDWDAPALPPAREMGLKRLVVTVLDGATKNDSKKVISNQ